VADPDQMTSSLYKEFGVAYAEKQFGQNVGTDKHTEQN